MSTKTLFASTLALTLSPALASAVPLPVGGFVDLNGTSVILRPELAGSILADTVRPFSFDHGGGNFTTGTVRDRVVRATATGTLDFYYQITVDVSSAGSIDFVTRESFGTFTTDVDWRADGPGTIAPDQASRFGTGDTVLFDFFASNLLFPGQLSRDFFIKTDATQFNEQGSASLAITSNLGGGLAPLVTYQPIPEPAGMALLGVAGLGLRRRR